MKNLKSFFSVAFFLPFLFLDFFSSTTPVGKNTTATLEESDYRIAVVMLYKDEEGNTNFMMPEEYIADIPNENKQLLLSTEGTFYTEDNETEIDFLALAKITGLDKKAKNISGSYNGKEVTNKYYFVFNKNAGSGCVPLYEKFVVFIAKCFGDSSHDGFGFGKNCVDGNAKKCKCSHPGNINVFPCYYCWDEPEFSISCQAI